jgi:hypothetical protein
VQPDNFANFKDKLLQDMIKEEVFLYQAKKLKIQIEQKEIDHIREITESSRNLPAGTVIALIKKYPNMEKSFKAQVAKNHIIQSYIIPKIFVTDAEMNTQIGTIKKTTLASIAFIDISGSDLEAKKASLENLESKLHTCKELETYTQDRNLGEVIYIKNKIDDLNDSLKHFVNNANIGQMTNLLKIDDTRYQMLMLCDKSLIDNGTKTKEEVQDEIYNKKLDDALNNFYLNAARKANIIVYNAKISSNDESL